MSTNGIKNNVIREMDVPVWGESMLKGMKEYKRAQDEMNKLYEAYLRLVLFPPYIQTKEGIKEFICE